MPFINIGRITGTNITFYRTDWQGRDRYISYIHAGFWKDKHMETKQKFPHKKFEIFHSLFHHTASFKYYSDGNGRDTYILIVV